ncbi:MAG: hypothetical protein GDA56_07685 [Hormoscilla sp. GM7CHS1pb]|nr:hypothetical protein [Hormoscilla sp. GM7CHS1pb]
MDHDVQISAEEQRFLALLLKMLFSKRVWSKMVAAGYPMQLFLTTPNFVSENCRLKHYLPRLERKTSLKIRINVREHQKKDDPTVKLLTRDFDKPQGANLGVCDTVFPTPPLPAVPVSPKKQC